MIELRWESWATILGLLLTGAYIVHPGPYAMGAFTFIAQPLFALTIGSYLWKVARDLRRRRVL
jgi:hypothetical protein